MRDYTSTGAAPLVFIQKEHLQILTDTRSWTIRLMGRNTVCYE